MAYSGKYQPKNPHKYKGNRNNVVYRSLWERKFMVYLDNNPKIIQWSSEEVVIPYISPVDKRKHKYYPDFLVTIKNNAGTHTYLCEIKPKKQCVPPTNRKSKYFLTEQRTYVVNQAKWKAAKNICRLKGWKWKVITEKELQI